MSRHPRNGTRTQKDEVEYDEQCRAENNVMGDMVCVLRNEVGQLRKNEAVLFKKLIEAEEALMSYRKKHLEYSQKRAELGDDIPGFYWAVADGWHRDSERKS